MMMQLRILLHIFLLLFFVGIVFGRHASLFEEILERDSTAVSEGNSGFLGLILKLIEVSVKLMNVVNILCNCKELKEFISMEDWTMCKMSNTLSQLSQS